MDLRDILFDEENKPIARKIWTGVDGEDSETGSICYAEIKKVVINRDSDSAIHFEVYSSKEAKQAGRKKLADKIVQIPLSSISEFSGIVKQEAYKLALSAQNVLKEYYEEIPLTDDEISVIIESMPEQPEQII